jgi:hypothetical protein
MRDSDVGDKLTSSEQRPVADLGTDGVQPLEFCYQTDIRLFVIHLFPSFICLFSAENIKKNE